MKNILLIADAPAGGGGADELAKLISRLEALDARVMVIEKSKDLDALMKRVGGLEKMIKDLGGLSDKLAALELKFETLEPAGDLDERITALEKAKPLPARLEAKPEIKSADQHFADELALLESDPSFRIEQLMNKAKMSEEDAGAWVQKRIAVLRRDLGITKPKAKTSPVKRAAALVAAMAALLFVFITPAMADQQGYPQQYVAMTNLPVVIIASGNTNILSPYGTTNNEASLTNEVIIHRGQGLGLEWGYNTAPGANGTNSSLFVTPSTDGTNLDTYQAWQVYSKSFGQTNVVITTNWNANQLVGYKALFITSMTNGNVVPTSNNWATWNVPQGGP